MRYIFYTLSFTFLLISCAQFVPPTGGKKDIIPPKLISSDPINKSINVDTKKITLRFDEYVDYSSIKQDLLIIPDPPSSYIIKQKNKDLTLLFDKPLSKNTTYSFYFRNSIKDLSERNPSNNLKLVFSTGPIIDSLSIKGNVRNIHTKQAVLNATFALFKADTSIKKKPSYFIKTDSSGNYLLENLKPGTYKILVFTDNNSNLILDSKTEDYGFIQDSIVLEKSIELPLIEIYKNNSNKNKIKKGISREHEYLLQFDKPLKNIKQISKDTLDIKIKDKQTLAIFKTNLIKTDSTLFTFIAIDSLNRTDTLTQKIYFTKPSKQGKINAFNIENAIKNNEPIYKQVNYDFTFDYPIVKFDSSRIILKSDTIITKEKTKLIWKSKTHLLINVETTAKKKVSLFIPSNTFTNIKSDTSNNYYIENPILRTEDLGSISGICPQSTESKIIQLIQEETNEIIKETISTSTFSFKNILPNSYKIKIIVDTNKNGIWDAGNYESDTSPEKIILSKESIKLKANFDIKNIKFD